MIKMNESRDTQALAWLQTVVAALFLLILCFPRGRNTHGYLMAALWSAMAAFWWLRARKVKAKAELNDALAKEQK